MKNFAEVPLEFLKKTASITAAVLLFVLFFIFFEIYVPLNPNSHEIIVFTVEKGWSDDLISEKLKEAGIIRSSGFFSLYAILSLKHFQLQAGEYNLSPKMSIHEIVNKMAHGQVIKDTVIILEGWDTMDIGKYLESKNICTQKYFISLTQKKYSDEFSFLSDKPNDVDLEGYLFPDTYEISKGDSCEDVLAAMLDNFSRKISPLEQEIKNQKKTIFDVVTMASLIEKEVRILSDKKIVSGILWKRIAIGMPLQLDATINYITGKNDPGATIKDTKIDSPYNTYKYNGLPKGPIANPGIASITAAVYPTKTNYWYYLSNGKTYFSETFEQHKAARAKYLQ